MDTKRCSKCSKELPLSAFYQRTGAKSYHSACKACERVMVNDWYERNKEKATAKMREWRERKRQKHYRQELVLKYGVEPKWFDEQLQRQGNSCVCCKRPFQLGNKQTTPHVNHCHDSQAVRGILCNRCNTVLGLCEDDDKLLSALGRYLRKWHQSTKSF